MKIENIIARTPYEGCTADLDSADIVIVGAGFDGTSSYRPGSRFAPLALRTETFFAQEDYSPYFKKDLKEKAVHDLGDIDLPFGNKEEALKRIFETTRAIHNMGKRPCMIGGEHLVSLPAIQAAFEKYPELRIVQLDAHLDLIDNLFGENLSHGTVMRRAYDLLGEGGRIFQVGIRSGSKKEWEFAEKHTRLYPFSTQQFLPEIPFLKEYPVYLTLDLDVFDPSLLPGTGTPEAGGIFFQEFIELLQAMQAMNIVACDMVELSPQIDATHNSTITASKILRELLISL